MRRPNRNCRKRCHGCDACWICRHSYPDTITITPLGSYEAPFCTNMTGTFVAAPWGGSSGGPPPDIEHQSWNNRDSNKPACRAFWSGECEANIPDFEGLRYVWFVHLLVGTGGGGPGGQDTVPRPVWSGAIASSRVLGLVGWSLRNANNTITFSTREERYFVDLPKSCPSSGVYTLAPQGPVWISGSTQFGGVHSFELTIEIFAGT